MNTETTTSVSHDSHDSKPIPPALTRALRGAIQSDGLEQIFRSAGAKEFQGTPIEVLEELAAAQTAVWMVGAQSGPMAAPAPNVAQPTILEAASGTIDSDALKGAAELVGVRGSNDIQRIQAYLAANLACTAVEATRFATAEGRPVDHNCVAIGGSIAARAAWQGELSQRIPSGR